MILLLEFISGLISTYIIIVFATVILSWLMGFGVVNPHNPTIRSFYQMFLAVTEPVLAPIRRMLPDLGAVDISPVVLLLGLQFVQQVVLSTAPGSFLCTYAALCRA